MKPNYLKVTLGFSLLFNLSVVGAAGYHAWDTGHWRLPFIQNEHVTFADEHLGLNEAQSKLWREKEISFKRDLMSAWGQIREHRERMIREIFSPQPDKSMIEAERAAIARLQEEQQRQVIAQLMSERDMLDDQQRESLAHLLIRQHSTGSLQELLRLHRD